MTVSVSSIENAIKRLYSKADVENAVYKDNPFYAMVQKEGDFKGTDFAYAVKYRDPLTYSPTFATAQALAQSSTTGAFRTAQFRLTRVKGYQLYTLETEAILATKGDNAAFLSALTTEVDSALNDFGRNQAKQLYNDGAGDLGQVTVSSTTFTMQKVDQIANIEEGMTVVCAATRLGALRNSGTGSVVTGVNRSAGSFTVSSNVDSTATGDYVYVKGSRAAGAITSADYLNIAGLEAWVPATAPDSTTFFNVDRSKDVARLGGHRQDISGFAPEEGLVTALNLLAREGGRPSHLFINFSDMGQLQRAMGARAVTEYQKVGSMLFSSVRLNGPKGDVMVIADQNCPTSVGWLLDLPTWRLKHLGDLPNMIDLDGNRLSRESAADRFEGRMSFYGNLYCKAPGNNMRLVLPSGT